MAVLQVYVSEEVFRLIDGVRGELSPTKWVAGLVKREVQGEGFAERLEAVERKLAELCTESGSTWS